MYSHAQAPVRIGIAGGGTDLPAWTKDRVGRCLSLAIDTYVHAVAITRPDGQVVASYRQRDADFCVTEIANGLIRESALLHDFEDGFEVHTLSEVTSRGSGLGVSSSIAVALAACFSRMRELARGAEAADLDRDQIARAAWTVEIDRLRRPIGRQDHMAAAHGGLRLYAFEGTTARVERTFSPEDAAWVAARLALVPLEMGHDARAILSGVKDAGRLAIAYEAVDIAVQAIESRDAPLLGRAIAMGQASKTAIPGAVPDAIGALVEAIGRVPGVYGCKVAGAGGGGHLVLACQPDAREAVGREIRMPVRGVSPDLVGVRSEGWSR